MLIISSLIMASTFVYKLVKSFIKPIIPPIDGNRTYVIIHVMHKLLISNATSINTNLGCGLL